MISVIIPAFNAAATIDNCLHALQKQTLPASAYEIIVVDDCSHDDTAVKVAKHSVRLIELDRNLGAAAARNKGIAAAEGDLLFFTDADCEPHENWLAEMSRPFQADEVVGAKGVYQTKQRQIVARFVQIEYEDKYDLMAGQPTIDFVDTYSAAYRQHVFAEVGGFDESIRYVEDQEFSFRVAENGGKMVFQPTAVVDHLHADSWVGYARKKFWIGCWKARFIRRYPDRLIKDSHTPQILKVQMGLAALTLFSTALAILFPLSGLALLTMILLFLLTTLPFCKKAWSKDKQVALLSPWLLFVRACALGFGFVWGNLQK